MQKQPTINTLVTHSGSITLNGNGGDVTSSGTIDAAAVHGSGGNVTLQSTGMTLLDGGSIDVHGGIEGGVVHVLGDEVGLFGDASIDATGVNGGGTVLMGGDYHGGNSAIQNASQTFVGTDASIDADALYSGVGGKVVVWSDDRTQFFGDISSRGGNSGGDGGFVEVSGHDHLNYVGLTDTSASRGQQGTLLLDPTNITIKTAGPDTVDTTVGNPTVFSDTGSNGPSPSILTVATLQTQLASTNVQVTTASSFTDAGNISVNNNVTWASANNLTLTANNNITIANGVLINATGGGGITMTAGGTVNFGTSSGALTATGVQTTTGSVSVTAAGNINLWGEVGPATGNITTTSGSVSLISTAGAIRDGNNDTVGTGDDGQAIITTSGPVSLTAAGGGTTVGAIGTGAAGAVTDIDIVGVTNLTVNATGNINISENDGTNYANLNITLDPTTATNTYHFATQGSPTPSAGVTFTDTAGQLIIATGAISGGSTNISITDAGVSNIELANNAINNGSGDVTLTASNGSIVQSVAGATNTNITTTGNITLTAHSNIGASGATAIIGIADTTGVVSATASTGLVHIFAQPTTGTTTFGTIVAGGVGAAGNVTLASNSSITTNSTVTAGSGASVASIAVDSDNTNADTLTLGGAVTAGTVNYTGGTDNNDTLVGPDAVNSWAITGTNVGTLNGGNFSQFVNLTGGTSDDTFTFSNTAKMTGAVNGGAGGINILDLSAYTTAVNATLTSSVATGYTGATAGATNPTGGFSNITQIKDGTTVPGTLTGDNNATTWSITGGNSGTLNDGTATLTWSGFGSLTGGSSTDAFTLSGGTLTSAIDGGAGVNTLTGDNVINAWTITTPNHGTVTGVGTTFSNIGNLVGGTNNDTFT
ncbi:MAG: beta strand repeat-containing protein, partial [Gammaproteobacteria bacterium]